MQVNEMFRPGIFEDETVRQLQDAFRTIPPIRHLVIDNFLESSIAHSIYTHFPKMDAMNTHYKGINEKKAEHSDFTKLDQSFDRLHKELSSPSFINWLQTVTGIPHLETIEDRLGYGLHQGANNSFLDIHIDYNLHPIKKLYRKLNLIIFFNEVWENNWGGHLELWDAGVKNCIQSIQPTFNRCVIFECSNVSYHGYNMITVPEEITRKSCYQYYFIPVTDSVSFHDTIFKPRPQESLVKKAKTYTKDFVKNTAKKILMKLGWKSFLK
ncbi:MAG: 2OG-Fe(II) oxygenase [Chitinophagaceae bacterium]|nr:2OG-Fe(II) oxygenase [Chitinophagaceae bacterium]